MNWLNQELIAWIIFLAVAVIMVGMGAHG